MASETQPIEPWHAWPFQRAAERLSVDPETGLSEAEVERRRAAYGANVLPRPTPPSLLVIYVRQFMNPLIYLLAAAAVVSVVIGEASDAWFIFGVLQVNALIGTYQEAQARNSALRLDAMIHNWAVVLRDGERRRIDGRDLVPGDVVFLESGAQVPADIRLSQTDALRLDESLRTGESVRVDKAADATVAADAVAADRDTMMHAGTTVVSGRASGVVTATGVATEIGRIAHELAVREPPIAPLVRRLERFTRALGAIVVGAIALLAAAMVWQGAPIVEIFLVSVALAVAALPEGLPVAITVALSVGCHRMAGRNVIVRSLPAVEGLGACTLIASDKTGTLTCNELTVKRLLIPGDGGDAREYEVTGQGYNDDGHVDLPGGIMGDGDWAAVHGLAEAGALCNEASLHRDDGHWQHFGDTVDVAFLALAAKVGLSREALVSRYPEAGAIVYEPAHGFAANFNDRDGRLTAHVKGAAEVVLPMCTLADRDAAIAQAERLAGEGYRVLAVAAGPVAAVAKAGAEITGLRLLGFVGLIDPLRQEARDAVAVCRESGIDVRMITGDHPATAQAIARDLGIWEAGAPVVTGARLHDLEGAPAERRRAVAEASIFARVEPLQKLEIVESLRSDGHFVAVTGDGVNDAPALTAADIGVAMGQGGTDAARDAADLILSDDNFASIVAGVEEGRIAYDNVRKVVYLLVSTGAAEVALFFFAFLGGLPLPFYAVQLLWLNLVTQGLQHTALAFEGGEEDVATRPPRPPGQRIFDPVMIGETVVSGLFMGAVAFFYFKWLLGQGMNEFEARNALLLMMVLFENAHVFNCRSETRSAFQVPLSRNWLVVGAVVVSQGAHIVAMHLPGFGDVLRVKPVAVDTWVVTALIAASVIVVMEAYKLIQARFLRDRR